MALEMAEKHLGRQDASITAIPDGVGVIVTWDNGRGSVLRSDWKPIEL
jgi:hypothetical protein